LTRGAAAGRPAACRSRADGPLPAPGRLDPREPQGRVGSAAGRDPGDGRDRRAGTGAVGLRRGVRLAPPVRDAHPHPPADRPTDGRMDGDNPLMAYDEDLANRIREIAGAEKDLTEQRMFGGLAFLIGGHMAV